MWERVEIDGANGFRNLFFHQLTLSADLRQAGQPNDVTLSLACRDGVTDIALLLTSKPKEDEVTLSVVLDVEAPWQEVWTTSETSKNFLGLWDRETAIAFIQRIVPSQRLTVQFKLGRRIATYSFDMKDAESHAGEIATRCGWTLQ